MTIREASVLWSSVFTVLERLGFEIDAIVDMLYRFGCEREWYGKNPK